MKKFSKIAVALAIASTTPAFIQAASETAETFYANGGCKGNSEGRCAASTSSYNSTNADRNNGTMSKPVDYNSSNRYNTTRMSEDSRTDYNNASIPEPLSYNEPVGGTSNPSRMNSAAGRMNSGAASSQNDAYYNRGYDNAHAYDNARTYDNARVNQLRNQGYTTSYDTQQNTVTEAMLGNETLNPDQYQYGNSSAMNSQGNTVTYGSAARTSASITEAQLMGMLTPQTRGLYQSLDSQGKALALQIASQSTNTDKNQAVMEAAHRSQARQGMMNR